MKLVPVRAVARPMQRLEQPEPSARVGLQIDDADLLAGGDAPSVLGELVTERDFAGAQE